MSRYIDEAELLINLAHKPRYSSATIGEAIDESAHIDIVRCQDCKYWVYNFNGCSRNPCTEPWYATDFCNYGEREDE